ncbi:MAG: LPS-assembly protein LptD, partial [Bacteroidetes bacterium]
MSILFKNIVSKFSMAKLLISMLFILLISTPAAYAQVRGKTAKPAKDSTQKAIKALKDTSILKKSGDTVVQKIDTLNTSPDSLNAPVEYEAEDSGIIMIDAKRFLLYGKAKITQSDVKLTSQVVDFDQATNVVKAYGSIDTADGSMQNKPTIIQGESKSINDTIFFNMNTQKGQLKNSFYQEGDMYINARVLKRVDKDVAYGANSVFTTCNLDHPHFGFKTSKIKVINNKFAVAGPTFPVFEDVPLPIVLPFGIFPMSRGRQSGILPPAFATNPSFGIGLEGLGYYKVINDYVDATVQGNLYSYGGWNLNINPKYFRRYRYTGNFALQLQRSRILNSAAVRPNVQTPEFITGSTFNIIWSHSTDSKARPGTSFSANVRAGSTRFNQFIPNNAALNVTNMLTSSIQYTKSWNQGKYNLSVGAMHSQNSNTRLVTLNLPTLTFNMTTLYPFAKKERVGAEKWYEKLGVSYSGTLQSNTTFRDSNINLQRLLDTTQWGAQHNIPITLALPALGPIILSPGVSYSERWYGQTIDLAWNDKFQKVDTSLGRGLFRAADINFSLTANTRVFGTVNFKKGNVKAIRHEIKPFVGVSYKPDLARRDHYNVQVDTSGRTVRLSRFAGAVGGAFGEGTFGGMTFGIDNLFEMKVLDKTDTSGKATKKVKLIDGLSINSGYNFLAD